MSPSRLDEGFGRGQSPTTFELPVLRTKPSYEQLFKALKTLELPPTSWDGPSTQDSLREAKHVPQYLLSIVSSDLAWLENGTCESEVVEERKEELWELASRRLAERCGRSAMPEMTRTWVVPSSTKLPELRFDIREPPLTGDNLGLKTWGTAFAVVKRLEEFGSKYFGHLLEGEKINLNTANTASAKAKVLELGSGTGLVGIAAGTIWGIHVVLTDLPEIEQNLLFNISQNVDAVESMGGSIQGEILDWKNPNSLAHYPYAEFEIVIAADSFYDDEHPELVAQNINRYLKPHESSRVLVAIPMRDRHTRLMVDNFKKLMQGQGLGLIHHGEDICHDDWTELEEEAVKCWWGIWRPIRTAFP